MATKTLMVRSTLRFPGLTGNPAVPTALSIPGPSDAGGFLSSSIVGGVPIAQVSSTNRFIDRASQRLVFGASQRNGLDLSAIAISPDSAIHSCLISMSGSSSEMESFRCSPGNPVSIPQGLDHVWVSQISGIPIINSFDDGLAWDANETNGYQSTTNNKSWSFPLRLLLIYGEVPNMQEKRSPYHGYIKVVSGLRGVISNYFFCIDGRRQTLVSMAVIAGGAGVGTTGVTVTAAVIGHQTNETFPDEDRRTSFTLSQGAVAPSAGTLAMFRVDDPVQPETDDLCLPILRVTLNSTAVSGSDAIGLQIVSTD